MKSILGYAVQFLVDGLEGDAHREASDDGLRVDGTYAEARVPRSDAIPTLERMLRDRVGTEKVGA